MSQEEEFTMIPKIIHYCWFGEGDKPRLANRCIASWKRICPDYTIIEWNETNFDLDQHPYLRWCHDQRKWAFLSDFARLLIVWQHGGIYFDTDVELLRRPDELLGCEAFYGFENHANVATGLGFGAQPRQITVGAMLERYTRMRPDQEGGYPLTACPALNTEALVFLGLKLDGMRQTVAGAEILPEEYLNPYDDPTGRLRVTDNTISVHWYSKSWMSKTTILRSNLTRPIHRLFGVDCLRRFKK